MGNDAVIYNGINGKEFTDFLVKYNNMTIIGYCVEGDKLYVEMEDRDGEDIKARYDIGSTLRVYWVERKGAARIGNSLIDIV